MGTEGPFHVERPGTDAENSFKLVSRLKPSGVIHPFVYMPLRSVTENSACNLILNAILKCYSSFKVQVVYKMLKVLWQFFQ